MKSLREINGRIKSMLDTCERPLAGEPTQHQAQDYEDAEGDEGSIENRLLVVKHAVYDQSVQVERLDERLIECMTVGFTELQNLSTDQ